MSCNNCERVEQEVCALKSFISGWFETFSRRFDDQDEKLTVLMDAVAGVQIESDQKVDLIENGNESAEIPIANVTDSCDYEEDIKNVILFFNDSLNELNQSNSPQNAEKTLNAEEPDLAETNSSLHFPNNRLSGIFSRSETRSECLDKSNSSIDAGSSTVHNSFADERGNFFLLPNDAETQFSPINLNNYGRDESVSAITVECLPPCSSTSQDLSFIPPNLRNISQETNRFRRPPFSHGATIPLEFTGLSNNPFYRPQPTFNRPNPLGASSDPIRTRKPVDFRFQRSHNSRKQHPTANKFKLLSNTHVANVVNQVESQDAADQSTKDNVCNVCTRQFGSVKALNRHKYVKHSGDRVLKFKCKLCDKQYSWSECLHRHIATVHKT